MRKEKDLIAMYFKLSNITFVDEVLTKLGITEEYRIEKPGKNLELHHIFLSEKIGPKFKQHKQLLKMVKETRPLTKAALMTANHGY